MLKLLTCVASLLLTMVRATEEYTMYGQDDRLRGYLNSIRHSIQGDELELWEYLRYPKMVKMYMRFMYSTHPQYCRHGTMPKDGGYYDEMSDLTYTTRDGRTEKIRHSRLPQRSKDKFTKPLMSFKPRNKSKGEEPYIPFIGHYVWLSRPSKPKIMSATDPQFANIWDNIALLRQDDEDWQIIFWTNNATFVELNETVCQGNCHVKVMSEKTLPGYDEFKLVIEEMISNGHFSIDAIRVLVTKHFGGYYMDADVHIENSPAQLHYHLNMYIGLEHFTNIGIGAGTYAVSPEHPVIITWLQLLREFYRLGPSQYGVHKLIPNPISCSDFMFVSGPRLASAAFWISHNKPGYNDFMFHENIMNLDNDNDVKWLKCRKAEAHGYDDYDYEDNYMKKFYPWNQTGECFYRNPGFHGCANPCNQQTLFFYDKNNLTKKDFIKEDRMHVYDYYHKLAIVQPRISYQRYDGSWGSSCSTKGRYGDASMQFVNTENKGNIFDKRIFHIASKEVMRVLKEQSNQIGRIFVWLYQMKNVHHFFKHLELPQEERLAQEVLWCRHWNCTVDPK